VEALAWCAPQIGPCALAVEDALALCDLGERLIERAWWRGRRRTGGRRLGRTRTPGCGPPTLAGARAAVDQLLEPAIELRDRVGHLIVVTACLGNADGRARTRELFELLRERIELGAHLGILLGRRRILTPPPVVTGLAAAITVAARRGPLVLACRLPDHRI